MAAAVLPSSDARPAATLPIPGPHSLWVNMEAENAILFLKLIKFLCKFHSMDSYILRMFGYCHFLDISGLGLVHLPGAKWLEGMRFFAAP